MKLLNIKKVGAIAVMGAIANLFSLPAEAFTIIPSTVEKVILLDIDISGSVDPTEYGLMMEGYAKAFENSVIQKAIVNLDSDDVPSNNGIVIGVQFWATQQQMFTDGTYSTTAGYTDGNKWFYLDSETDMNQFATLLRNAGRPPKKDGSNNDLIGGGTNLAGALDFSRAELNALFGETGSDVEYVDGSSNIETATNNQGTVSNVLIETIVDVSSDGYHDRRTLDGNSGSCDDNKNGINPNVAGTSGTKAGLSGLGNCQPVLTEAILALVDDGDLNTSNPANIVNGIPILGETGRYRDLLDIYYEQGLEINPVTVNGETINQIGPVIVQDSGAATSPFIQSAESFADFDTSIRNKLFTEITGEAYPVPFEFSPGLGLIIGSGLFGYLKFRRK